MGDSLERIRVFVADDHPIYRDGLIRCIQDRPDLELAGEAASGHDALEGIRAVRPDVAILDVRMPGLDGTEVLGAIQRDSLGTRVVFLSASAAGDVVYRAIAMGAGAYLSKGSDRIEIFEAVARVARGETYVPPDLHTDLAAQIRLREREERPTLTPREREILTLTADGCSAPAIAAQLHLSPATVKTHLQSLYEKLGVSDRAAAVATAMRQGLLE